LEDFFDTFLVVARHSLFMNDVWHHESLFPLLFRTLDDLPFFMGAEVFRTFEKAFSLQILTHSEAVAIFDRGFARLNSDEFQFELSAIFSCFAYAAKFCPELTHIFAVNLDRFMDKWNYLSETGNLSARDVLGSFVLVLSVSLAEVPAETLIILLASPITVSSSLLNLHLDTLRLLIERVDSIPSLSEGIVCQLYYWLSLRVPLKKTISVAMITEWARNLDPDFTLLVKYLQARPRQQAYVQALLAGNCDSV
jgi:hypothetical protein